jgi:hypothetical protein
LSRVCLDSAVGIATGYLWGHFSSPSRFQDFRLLHFVQTGSGTHPASCRIGKGALFIGLKRPGREAHNSSSSSAEIKHTCSYTSTSAYVFMAQCLISYAQGQLLRSTVFGDCFIANYTEIRLISEVKLVGGRADQRRHGIKISPNFITSIQRTYNKIFY